MDPPQHSGMNEGDAAFSHQRAHITVAKFISDVPADGLNDEQTVEVATFEECWLVRGGLGHAADYLHSSAFAPEPPNLDLTKSTRI